MERGIGTSRGIGIGHVLIVYNASAVVNRGTHYNAEEEKKRFFEARKTFIEQTEELLSELEKNLVSLTRMHWCLRIRYILQEI